MLRKSYPTFVYVNLNQFQETRENICVRDKNKNIYIDTWKKNKQKNKTSNSSISLVSEDMLRTSSSCKPKKVRHKGGISSWCKRLRKVTDVYRYWEWNICPRRYPTWTRSTISARSRRMSIIDVFGVNLICTECTGTCPSNYHTITTTTDPHIVTWKHEQHRPDYATRWHYKWYSVQYMWYIYMFYLHLIQTQNRKHFSPICKQEVMYVRTRK